MIVLSMTLKIKGWTRITEREKRISRKDQRESELKEGRQKTKRGTAR